MKSFLFERGMVHVASLMALILRRKSMSSGDGQNLSMNRLIIDKPFIKSWIALASYIKQSTKE
jgi:hypothetical protein